MFTFALIFLTELSYASLGFYGPLIEDLCKEGSYVHSDKCGFGYTLDTKSAPSYHNLSPNDPLRMDPTRRSEIDKQDYSCYISFLDEKKAQRNKCDPWQTAIHYANANCELGSQYCWQQPEIEVQNQKGFRNCIQGLSCERFKDGKKRVHQRTYCLPIELGGEEIVSFAYSYDMEAGFGTPPANVDVELLLRKPWSGDKPEDRMELIGKSEYSKDYYTKEGLINALKASHPPKKRLFVSYKTSLNYNDFQDENKVLVGGVCDDDQQLCGFYPDGGFNMDFRFACSNSFGGGFGGGGIGVPGGGGFGAPGSKSAPKGSK